MFEGTVSCTCAAAVCLITVMGGTINREELAVVSGHELRIRSSTIDDLEHAYARTARAGTC
jgi:hypothetical protein